VRFVVVASVVVIAVAACDRPAAPPPRAAPVDVAGAEDAHDDRDARDDHDEDAANDGKDHRALYVDRVAADQRNFVVDAAGALDGGAGAAFDDPAGRLPKGTTYKSVVVDGKGLLVGGADGSLWYAKDKDGAFVAVRDPRG
jgi:hypothetical protein